MTAATKAALGEKLRNNLQGHGGGGEKRKLDAVEGPSGGDDGGLGGGDGLEMAKAQKFDGDGNVDEEFAAFINSPASGAPNSSQPEKVININPPIAIKVSHYPQMYCHSLRQKFIIQDYNVLFTNRTVFRCRTRVVGLHHLPVDSLPRP